MGLKRCSYLAFHDGTGQLWWRQNARLENTALGDNGEMSNRWLFSADLCVKGVNYRVKDKIIHGFQWMTNFGPPWNDLPMIFTFGYVIFENHWRIGSLETKNSLFKVTCPSLFMQTIQRGQPLYYLTLKYKFILFLDIVFLKFHSTFLHVV